MATRVVTAPWVLTGDPAPPLPGPLPRGAGAREVTPSSLAPRSGERAGERGCIRDGAVVLDGDHVVAIGRASEIEPRFGRGERLDAVLLPALVNAHTHLELSHLAGRVAGGGGLVAWIQRLVAARAEEPAPGTSLDAAVAALARAGVAAVGEVSNTAAALPLLGLAGLAGTLFHEVYGFSSARLGAALAQAAAARARAGEPAPGLRIVTTPHAVYSTSPRAVAELLRAGPASIHLAEDPAERLFTSAATGPFAELMRALGAADLRPLGRSAVACAAPHLGPRSLAVHCVDLDDEDVEDLARSGATVVVCPRSNLHIGGRAADLPRLLARGIPLAVGTDSLASAPSLSPLAEVAALARLHPAISPGRLLALAWNGAAVGAPGVGRLASGMAPGVVAAPLAGARPEDPAAWLAGAFGAEERPLTWIARHRPEGT